MNAPPDWQDGECCFRCRTQFTLVARKHHCRNCGNIFCAKCSSQQIPLPKLNIEKNVRVCDTCYEKINGKNDNSLALALGSNDKEEKDKESAPKLQKSQTNSKSSSSSGSKSSASAPSEQELKEEEEFQLALALSLSETPTKVTFPDYRHLEEPKDAMPSKASTTVTNNNHTPTRANDVNASKTNSVNYKNSTNYQATMPTEPISFPSDPGYDLSAVFNTATVEPTTTTVAPMQQLAVTNKLQPQQLAPPVNQQQGTPQLEYHIQDRDQELFRYIGEVHGILEVFNNRLEACKLRNRPITNDGAIQSLFIKLNSEIQPKISEYIKAYEEERGVFERLQDKLSQIADARAALDALREEHQDKLRQQAAEAEKQRQSQLATKLEAMRQKKTQMMQYQRELAMQRIREQEMMLQQQQPQQQQQVAQDYTAQPNVGQLPYQQPLTEQQSYDGAIQQHQQQPQLQTTQQQGQIQANNLPPVATSLAQPYGQQQQQQHSNLNMQYHQPYVAPVSHSSISTYGIQNHQQPPQVSNQHQYNSYMPQQQQQATMTHSIPPPQPSIDRAALAQLEKQYLPDAKPDEEAPLISFDD